jgi:predicted nucleic-acid-binding protein
VRITVDTNVLVRVAIDDDRDQALAARAILAEASLVAITLPCLCEYVWVLKSVYRIRPGDIADSIRVLAVARNIEIDRPAVEAGLAMLEAGGDFADGVIAHAGAWLGADKFVSFDRKAVTLLNAQGQAAQLL